MRLTAAVHQLADDVRAEIATRSDGASRSEQTRLARAVPPVAGALLQADGTLTTHTDVRQVTGPLPQLHPVVTTLLDAVPAAQRPPHHGTCAEVVLVSDAVQAWETAHGRQVSTVDQAREALAGARITTVDVRRTAPAPGDVAPGAAHLDHRPLCASCAAWVGSDQVLGTDADGRDVAGLGLAAPATLPAGDDRVLARREQLRVTAREVAGSRFVNGPRPGRNGWLSQLRATTRLTDLRAAAGADVVLAGDGLLRITPVDGGDPVVVRLVRGDTAGTGTERAMATTTDPHGGRPTITISDRAPVTAVRRALAHEVAALLALRDAGHTADGAPDPQADRAGRFAELRLLRSQLTDGDLRTRAAALAELPPLLEELGLARPAPTAPAEGPDGVELAPVAPTAAEREYARRWADLPADLRPLVRAVNDVAGPGAAPTAVPDTWRYAVKNAVALLPVLVAQGLSIGLSAATGQLAGVLGAGTTTGALLAAAAVTTRLEREFAVGTEHRTALADAHSAAPAAVAALDADVRALAEQARAADQRLVDDLQARTGAEAAAAELPPAAAAPVRSDPASRADAGTGTPADPRSAAATVLSLGRYLTRYGNGPLVAAVAGLAVNAVLAAALSLPLLPAIASLAVAAGAGYASAWAERALAERKARLEDAKRREQDTRTKALELARADLRTAPARRRLAELTAEEARLAGAPAPVAPVAPAAPAPLTDAEAGELRTLLAARVARPRSTAAARALADFLARHDLAAPRLTADLPPGPVDQARLREIAAEGWVRNRVALPEELQRAVAVWDDAGSATPGVLAHLPKWGVTTALPALGTAAVLGALAPGSLVAAVLPAVGVAGAPLAAWAEQRFAAAQEQAKDQAKRAGRPGEAELAARDAHARALLELVARAEARLHARRMADGLAELRADQLTAAAEREAAADAAVALAAEVAALPAAADPGTAARTDRADVGPPLPATAPALPTVGQSAARFALPAAATGGAGAVVAGSLLAGGVGVGAGGVLTGAGPALVGGAVGGVATAVGGLGVVAGERLVGNDVLRRQADRDAHLGRHVALLVEEARSREQRALAAEVLEVQRRTADLLAELDRTGPSPRPGPARPAPVPAEEPGPVPGTDQEPDPEAQPTPATGTRAAAPSPGWSEIRRLAIAPHWDRRRVEDVTTTPVAPVEDRPFPAPQPHPRPGPRPEPQPEPDPQPGPQPGPQPEPEPQPGPQSQPQPGPRPGAGHPPLPPRHYPPRVPTRTPAVPTPPAPGGRPGGGAGPAAGPVWRRPVVQRLQVLDGPTGRTVSAVVQLEGPDGRPVRLLVRVLLGRTGRPVVLLADLDGAPVPGMVAAVLDLVACLGPEAGLPDGWAQDALWMVQCPSGPDDPYGLLREVEVARGDHGLRLTGRDRLLPPAAADALRRDRAVAPVAEALTALAGVPVDR